MPAEGLALTEKIEAAFCRAAWSVIKKARQTNTPIILREDGRIVERSPDELERALRQKLAQAGEQPPGDPLRPDGGLRPQRGHIRNWPGICTSRLGDFFPVLG